MRPIILHGHERPITRIKYNRDGDLLFSASRDARFNVWSSVDGELLGSYHGHSGVISDFDINPDSTILISGSADFSARLWDVRTGKCLHTWNFESPVRSVAFVPKSGDMAVIVTDQKMGQVCTAVVVKITPKVADIPVTPISLFLPGELTPATIVRWGPDNTIYMGHVNGNISCWDAISGDCMASKLIHKGFITDLQFHEDLTHFITSSKDMSSRIFDLKLEVIKTYKTDRPINSAAMSPTKDHIILGGGQDASQVTTTSSKSGKFESRLFHKILGQEFARIKGHIGPINSIAIHPNGTSFTSGAEEALIRIHHFDPDYFKFKLDPRDP